MSRIGLTSIRMHTQPSTTARQTANNSFGAKLRAGLQTTASAVGGATSLAAPLLPGGTIVSAALSGAKGGGGLGTSSHALSAAGGAGNAVPTVGSGPTPNVPGISSGSKVDQQFSQTKQLTEMQAMFNLQFLEMQAKVQHESRTFQTVSNVMKNRTDTAKNSIRNMS